MLSGRNANASQARSLSTSSSSSKPKESFISYVFKRVKQLYTMIYQNMRKFLWVGSLGIHL